MSEYIIRIRRVTK